MVDILSAPIPGESLTKSPGGAMYEQPPRFTDPEEALEYLEDRLMKESNLVRLSVLAEQGITAEQITKTLLMAGFMEGLWTPDIIMHIAGMTLYLVVAMLRAKGISIKPKNEDKALQKFMAQATQRSGNTEPDLLSKQGVESSQQVFNIVKDEK